MDEPARKRRRTTPPDERERLSSPLKKPPRRPSFASPTKASLSRFNPNVLPPKSSNAPRPTSRGRMISPRKQGPQYMLDDTTEQSRRNEYSMQETNERSQTSGGAEEPDPFRPKNVIARSPTQGGPTPVLAGGGEEDVFAPRNAIPRSPRRERGPQALAEKPGVPAPRSTVSRSPRRTQTPSGDLEETEVELPSTSPLRDLAPPDTPRRGVLFSSPSKRPPLLGDNIKQLPVKAIDPIFRKGKTSRPVDGPLLVEQTHEPKELPKQAPLNAELEKKKQKKAQLMHERDQLESHVTRCTREIDKFRDLAPGDILEPWERDTIVEFVNQICSSSTAEEEQAPTISHLLCSFLPFSMQFNPRPKPTTTLPKPALSHRPLDQEDPLPCLKLFTSLNFTSQVSHVSTEQTSILHQKHTISITDPQKLLTAMIDASIDSTTSEVTGLSIHLPSWAERDLGNFMRTKAEENDLNTACWAIGSYWELSKQRAEFWHKCESAFAHLKPGRMLEDVENFEQRPSQKPRQNLSRKDLRRHLGQDSLILEDKYVSLKINWRVTFDWTGEAESEINVSPALPALWSETDSSDSLKKIPEIYQALLQKKGVFEATKTMVALLMERS